MTTTRRNFLALAASAPLLGLAVKAAAGTPQCYDPATLPLSQRNRRRSMGYVDTSPDASRHCGACAFFTATVAGCGTCALLSGPVTSEGVCNSFAKKTP